MHVADLIYKFSHIHIRTLKVIGIKFNQPLIPPFIN